MTGSTDPSENVFKKIPKKFHDKAVQTNILWLNLDKIDEIIILQSAHKQGNLSFHFHAPGSKRRYPCTQTASRLSQNISPVCSSFVLVIASDMHFESESDTQQKISRYNPHFFAIFRRILRIKCKMTSDLFTVV